MAEGAQQFLNYVTFFTFFFLGMGIFVGTAHWGEGKYPLAQTSNPLINTPMFKTLYCIQHQHNKAR